VTAESALLEAAARGDEDAFRRLVEPYRGQLHAHCYRMLGSLHDADDALQEALLGAWKGLGGFEGRSQLRTWLYTIATNACLGLVRRDRSRAKVLPADRVPAGDPRGDLPPLSTEPVWLEPYPDERFGIDGWPSAPEARYDQREAVEVAFVAALQHLPATQRAVLILREVLGFSAAEAATALGTSVASVNSALQRARASLDARLPAESQQATVRALGDERARALVERFLGAWERADVPAIVAMLAEDAAFAMPPLPVWFAGRDDIGTFLAERVFATPWRFALVRANAQFAIACYRDEHATGDFRVGSLSVLRLDGERVAEIMAFLDPATHEAFGLPFTPPS
jgi:RNA polymerase sigma-70 factor (TIGR02960 family)